MKKIVPFALLLTSTLLTSCTNSFELSQKNFFSFNTIINLSTYDATADNVIAIESIFDRYNRYFDAFNSYEFTNNLYSINSTNEFVKVDKELFDALKIADEFYKDTKGYFNPYLGELTFEYKKGIELFQKEQIVSMPSELFIKEALKNISNFSLEFDSINSSVKRNGKAKIDLGAFAKGYTVDKVNEYIEKNNIKYYFVNAGNSSCYFSIKPNNKPYTAGIKYLDKKKIEISNSSLGISSVFEQNVVIDEKMYSHIVNPFNGLSETYYDFSIVKHKSSLVSDIFSTVLMVVDDKNIIDSFKETYGFSFSTFKNKQEIYSSGDIEFISR